MRHSTPGAASVEGQVERQLGQHAAVVADHVPLTAAAAPVERHRVEILGHDPPPGADGQDRAAAKRAPCVQADDGSGGHLDLLGARSPRREPAPLSFICLDGIDVAKVQPRVRGVTVSHVVTF
jgi:hypothetical protein